MLLPARPAAASAWLPHAERERAAAAPPAALLARRHALASLVLLSCTSVREATASRLPLLLNGPVLSTTAAVLSLVVALPPGYRLSRLVPSVWEALEPGPELQLSAEGGSMRAASDGRSTAATLRLTRRRRDAAEVSQPLRLRARVYYCQEEAVCLQQVVEWSLPLAPLTDGAEEMVELRATVAAPSELRSSVPELR